MSKPTKRQRAHEAVELMGIIMRKTDAINEQRRQVSALKRALEKLVRGR
jgi:hypothetical protein